MPVRVRSSIRRLLFLLALLATGCASVVHPRASRFVWVVGQGCPAFDPQGPPDAVRWALERMCSRGLVERDRGGDIVAMAAERWEVTADSLHWTFHLRAGLRFTDGSPCTSADVARALTDALARRDHSTARALLRAASGPALVNAPDPRTLTIRLRSPNRHLLDVLALPGFGVPWRAGAQAGDWGVGLGPYAPIARSASRWLLVRAPASNGLPAAVMGIADTLEIRFVIGAGRMNMLLRAQVPDLAWPLPPGLFALPLPAVYHALAREATPPRRLLLVMRPDLPPTSNPAARHALAHALHRGDIIAALGMRAGDSASWLVGGAPFEFPARSEAEVRDWLDSGDLGRSFHVTMTYSADGPAAEVARGMQGDWAQLGLDVELAPVRATAFGARALAASGAQLTLCEEQALLPDPAVELAGYVQPGRDAPVGGFRTGWRTREFDPWIGSAATRAGFDRSFVERRLAEEDIVLPLAGTRWVWLERGSGPAAPFDPRYGPAGQPPPPAVTLPRAAGSR